MADNLEFLRELKSHVVLGQNDITHYEMAIRMINDWIDELIIENNK